MPPRMNSSDSYVFDLDGTISDPAVGIGRSLNHALEHFGHPSIAEDEVSRFIGPPLDQEFRAFVGDVAQGHIVELVAKYRERYADIGLFENVVYPGVPDVIRELDAAGLAIGLCTSKPVRFAERILHFFGLRQHFCFVSGGDIGISKTAQLRSLCREGLVDASWSMIGDRAVDIVAARENGLLSIGVLWGHGSREELRAASPRFLIESPYRLVELANVARSSAE
jgi:phosphoglycolate phosphatase